ncbi:MAG: hypothetical protein PVH93_05060 [Nitrosopumilaceae archaeon]|jgi:hypothetical protein
MEMYCPKCKSKTEFYEIDDGPDVDDDTIAYTSYNCDVCNIHLDGNNRNWYNGDEVVCYQQLEKAIPYMTSEEYNRLAKK